MAKPKIAKSFDIISQTITVEKRKNLKDDDGNPVLGLAVPASNKIYLLESRDVSKSQQLLTFYHEKAHLILYALGLHHMNLPEEDNIVDLLANILLQIDKTQVY